MLCRKSKDFFPKDETSFWVNGSRKRIKGEGTPQFPLPEREGLLEK